MSAPRQPSEALDGPVPPPTSQAYAEWVAGRRVALRTRHGSLARLYAQDLALWMASVGATGLFLWMLLRFVSQPMMPASIKPAALLVLAVTFGLSLFTFATAAPTMRQGFRSRSLWHSRREERLVESSHAEAAVTVARDVPEELVVVLCSGTAEDDAMPDVPAPTSAGYVPRSGGLRPPVVGDAPAEELLAELPGAGAVAPVVPGVLERLDLGLVAGPVRIEELVAPRARVVGLRSLDGRATRVDAERPCLDVTELVRHEVIAWLHAHGARFWLELDERGPGVEADLAHLAALGADLLVRAERETATRWPEGLSRPEGTVVVARSGSGEPEARAIARWLSARR